MRKPPRDARMDPRLRSVTVRQCLNHSGGWDRAVSGDPVNWEPQISLEEGLQRTYAWIEERVRVSLAQRSAASA